MLQNLPGFVRTSGARMCEGFQRLRLLWMRRRYTAKGGDRFIIPTLLNECFTEVIMRLREIGVHLKRLAVMFKRTLILPSVVIGEPHDRLQCERAGVNPLCLPESLERFVIAPLGQQ